MIHQLYSNSLCLSTTLTTFFGAYFIFGRVPDRKAFANYTLSRSIMGVALLVLSVSHLTLLLFNIRFLHPSLAISINLSVYYVEAWLFSSALMLLLKRDYFTWKRFGYHILFWVIFTLTCGLVPLLFGDEAMRIRVLWFFAVWFFVYSIGLAVRLLRTYKRAVKLFDEYHSDDIQSYIRWMSRFTYLAVFFGVGSGAFTFLPQKYIYLWFLSAIPYFIYLYVSYMNYLLLYRKVEDIIEVVDDDVDTDESTAEDVPVYYAEIGRKIELWKTELRFTKKDLNISDMAAEFCTNRTYLSNYFRDVLKMTFREWVNLLRLNYAKKLLSQNLQLTISEAAEQAGYVSLSYFTRMFSEVEGHTPSKWRKKLRSESKAS